MFPNEIVPVAARQAPQPHTDFIQYQIVAPPDSQAASAWAALPVRCASFKPSKLQQVEAGLFPSSLQDSLKILYDSLMSVFQLTKGERAELRHV